ncbi:MAG: LPP20 family lipoprotein [Breznakibacter sp.]
MRPIIVLMAVLVLMSGCAARKKAALEALNPKPAWVDATPREAGYYQAVGVARKWGSMQNYQSEARNHALSQMAGQVNAAISSTSILSQVEDRHGVSEILINNIRSKSEEFLEGYEMMGKWEDEVNYYEYYRLSKQKFAAIKEQRKRDALQKAVFRFREAERMEQEGQYAQALSLHAGVLDLLGNYLGESSLLVDSVGDFDPAVASLQHIAQLVKDMVVVCSSGNVETTPGGVVAEDRLAFVVSDGHQRWQPNIPVRFTYSGGYLRKDKAVSNGNGQVAGSVHQPGNVGKYLFCAQVDTRTFFQLATKNLLVRKLLDSVEGNKGCVNVLVK